MTRADIAAYVAEQVLIGAPDGIYAPLHLRCGYVFYLYPRGKDVGYFLDARGACPMPSRSSPPSDGPYIQCLSCGATDLWDEREFPDSVGQEDGDVLAIINRHLPEGLR